jgi:hypothetical protein
MGLFRGRATWFDGLLIAAMTSVRILTAGHRRGVRFPAQVGDHLFERYYPDIALPDRLGDLVERLVGGLHVVSPQRRRRTEQDDVCGGNWPYIQRLVVGVFGRQLATTPVSHEHDSDHDDHGDDQQYERHIKNRAML